MRFLVGILLVTLVICCIFSFMDYAIGAQTPPDYAALKIGLETNSCLGSWSPFTSEEMVYSRRLVRQDLPDPSVNIVHQDWVVSPQYLILGNKIIMADLTVWEIVPTQERPVLSQIQDQVLIERAKAIFANAPILKAQVTATWDYRFSTHKDGWKYEVICSKVVQ